MSEFEKLVQAILDDAEIDINPKTRFEKYLKNCVEKCGCEGLPAPKSRADALLYALAEKMAEGGGSYPISVTFKTGDTDYLKIGVANNKAKIAEPVEPTAPAETPFFKGWYNGANKIVFPISPEEDTVLTAHFTQYHTEIEARTAEQLIGSVGSTQYIKHADGTAICGYFHYSTYGTNKGTAIILVSENSDAASINHSSTNEFEYNDKRYYYCVVNNATKNATILDGVPPHLISGEPIDIDYTYQKEEVAKMLLAYYYGVE